ncbi:hypothetical protein ST47_g6951 [Ascochyta rabiei]|uniref:Uncharacterized protein n=1 Tax=Didymella rabiei TaxID=5454 RepID=A0A163BR84_DIDRA|nr:hypothetical protein ST47_g6951 [Ascochyta rabiei]
MSQPPPIDPRWVAMREKHQEEVGAFARSVATAHKDLNDYVEAAHKSLLKRHSQQERELYGLASSISSRDISVTHSVAYKTQPTASKMSLAPAYTSQKPLPMPGPERKQHSSGQSTALSTAQGSQRQKDQATPSAAAPQQLVKQQMKLLPQSLQAQPQKNEQAPSVSPKGQLFKPGQYKPSVTSLRRQPGRTNKYEIIDLCSDNENDDDDMIVEVRRDAVQKSTAVSTPVLPSIPTATVQLFGESSKKKHPPHIKRENGEAGRSTQGQPRLPHHARVSNHRPVTNLAPVRLPHSDQSRDSTALNSLSSPISRCTVSSQHQAQAPPQPAHENALSSFDRKNKTTPTNVVVQDMNNLTVHQVVVPGNKDLLALHHHKQDERTKSIAPSSSDMFARKDSDDGVDIEDVPMAYLNIKAILNQRSMTVSSNDSIGVASSASTVANPSIFTNDMQKMHPPTPPPSVASAPTTCQAAEAGTLLRAFKKPLPAAATPRTLDSAQIYTSTSRSPGSTLSANRLPDKLLIHQRGTSVASRTSETLGPSRKRKEVDLDDYEQFTYSRSGSPFTDRNKPSILPDSHSKRSKITASATSKPNGPPPPSASSVTPMSREKNGFGFRTVASSMPMTLSQMPSAKSKLSEPQTPIQEYHCRKSQIATISLGKRSAAVRAQEKIRKISDADEEFHTNDQIFQATAKEVRMGATVTTDLGRRLRSMSSTPVPAGTHSNIPKNSTLSDVRTASAKPAARTKTNRSVYAKEGSLSNRATEARPAARSRNISQLIGDDFDKDFEGDLDISEFTYVNGIIIQTG